MKTKLLFSSLTGLLLITNSFAGQGLQPGICTRACWGARAPKCGISQMGNLTRAVIHHTAGPSDFTTDYGTAQARVRGVQNYHMDSAGMCDIAYHFLVNAGGHIFEGRSGSMGSWPRGAHDGVNTDSFGFNWMGYFHPPYNQDPPPAMRNSLYDVIAWRMPSAWSPFGGGSYNGRTCGYLCGHRDALATACPGDIAYNNYITGNLNGGEARSAVNARKNPAPPPPSLHLDVYIKGTDNQLWHNWHGGVAWSGWGALGGSLGSDPTSACWGPGRVDIFWRGTDNALWHKWYDNGNWGGPESLGGTVVGTPDACSWGAGHLDVYVRGTDNGLWHRGFSGGVWNPWESVPGTSGTVMSDPSVASWSAFRIDAFYRGTGNSLKHLFWNGSWSGVEDLGGGLAGAPDVASWGFGRLDIVIRGTDNALWHKWYDGTAWSIWETLGGVLTADPTVAAPQANRIDVFVRGTDNALHHKWYAGGWSIWEWLGGGLAGAPDVCSWSK